MARVCSPCKVYDGEGTLETCPTCQAPMQFTLLPPPNRAAAPLALAEPTPLAGPRRTRTAEADFSFSELFVVIFRHRKLVGLVVAPFLIVCSYFGANLGGADDSLKSRYDQLRVGMDVDEVEFVLNPPRPQRGRIPMPHHNVLDRVPEEGPYTVNYSESGAGSITLRFRDGVLVDKSEQGVK